MSDSATIEKRKNCSVRLNVCLTRMRPFNHRVGILSCTMTDSNKGLIIFHL